MRQTPIRQKNEFDGDDIATDFVVVGNGFGSFGAGFGGGSG